jgi:hypothetical protein
VVPASGMPHTEFRLTRPRPQSDTIRNVDRQSVLAT